MNQFLKSAVQLINLHGKTGTYTSIVTGAYDIETGQVTNTETNHSVTMYKKHLKADQYNYPNLIGKSAAIFYLANYNITFVPKVDDKVLFDGETFTVMSVMEHAALSGIVMYRIVTVRG